MHTRLFQLSNSSAACASDGQPPAEFCEGVVDIHDVVRCLFWRMMFPTDHSRWSQYKKPMLSILEQVLPPSAFRLLFQHSLHSFSAVLPFFLPTTCLVQPRSLLTTVKSNIYVILSTKRSRGLTTTIPGQRWEAMIAARVGSSTLSMVSSIRGRLVLYYLRCS